MKRLDDINRTERYFTSTMLGGLLLYDDTHGVIQFLEWLIKNAEIKLHVVNDSKTSVPLILPSIVPDHIEVITELNIKRDLKYYRNIESVEPNDFSDKQNVPDVVIVYGEILLVIEGKFFVTSQSAKDIDAQLQLQKEEIDLMIDYFEGGIKYWAHIYLGPDNKIHLHNCDFILTWVDIEQISSEMLGEEHYITQRLQNANKRYNDYKQSVQGSNYSGKCSYAEIIQLCKKEGKGILVGFSGGKNKLRNTSIEELTYRTFKYDFRNNLHGKKTPSNWIHGQAFLDAISQR